MNAYSVMNVNENPYVPICNLIISLILKGTKQKDETKGLWTKLVDRVGSDSYQPVNVKLGVLSNVFNVLKPADQMRFNVFKRILTVASEGDELDAVLPTLKNTVLVETFMKEWGLSVDQRSHLLLIISQVLHPRDNSDNSYSVVSLEYLLKYLMVVQLNPMVPVDAAVLKASLRNALLAAINLPEILSFDDILALKWTSDAKLQDLFGIKSLVELIKIFATQSVEALEAFIKKNPNVLKESIITSREDAMRKIRVLSLSTLGMQYLYKKLGYKAIAQHLLIRHDEVEYWVIDAIRAGLIDARMDQEKETVVVSRASHRVFGKKEWMVLDSQVDEWRENMIKCLKVVQSSKKTDESIN